MRIRDMWAALREWAHGERAGEPSRYGLWLEQREHEAAAERAQRDLDAAKRQRAKVDLLGEGIRRAYGVSRHNAGGAQ